MSSGSDVFDKERNPPAGGPVVPDPQMNGSSAPEAPDADAPMAAPAEAASEPGTEAAAASAERDASERRAEFRRILGEKIRSWTEPTLSDGKWGFLKQNDLLRIDMPPNEFVEALAQDFPVESLTALGFYELVDGKLRLPSCLDGDPPLYVAIDDNTGNISISCGDNLLFPMTRTAVDRALERIQPDSTQTTETLFIVESQDAVEVMQRLELRAVTSAGLDALGHHDVEQLFSGDQRSDCNWRYYLTLVDLDVARLENRLTLTIGKVIERLAHAQSLYDIDPGRRFGVCRPSPDEFQVLERAASFGDSDRIRQLFEKWSEAAKSARISSWRSYCQVSLPSFAAARAALLHALRQTDEVRRRVEVSAAFPAYRAVTEALSKKFYATVDSARDPFEQVDFVAAAGYAEIFFASDPLVRAAKDVLAGRTPPSALELHLEMLALRQQCLAELRRICRDRKGKGLNRFG